MSFLEWDESLRLGVDLCDKQHQVLISHMNKLYDLSEKNAGFTELKSVLQDLEKSVVTHFADEEAYMQRIGFSGFKNHKAIHEQLLSKFRRASSSDGPDLTIPTGSVGSMCLGFLIPASRFHAIPITTCG